MVQTKLGRYWEQAKRWFFRKVWSFKTKERKRAAANVGPKPTNVKTFARKKASDGGSIGMAMVRQAQRDYKGTHIKGDLGGVKVGNKSYQKYYKGMV
jgi:hypothetical protein